MNQTDLEEALEALHEKSFHWALSCCNWHQHEAEEVIQTCYLKVLDGRARYNGRSSIKTWFFAVIRTTALEQHRKNRLMNAGLLKMFRLGDGPNEEETALSQDALLEDSQQKACIKRILSTLPKRQRQILELVFYQEMTIEDAARITGISLGSARTHYDRGKKKLQELVSQ